MRKFVLKLVLFLLPFALVLGFPVAVLIVSGELTSVSRVITAQEAEDQLVVGFAYSNATSFYKLQSTLQRKPAVLALGTSRVMQFRDFFFKAPRDFYNAGGGVDRLEDFRVFVDHLSSTPKLLIIGLDQYFFNDNWQGFLVRDYNALLASENRDDLGIVTGNWMEVYQDYLAGKFNFRALVRRPSTRIGLSAAARGAGFRSDGSYSYGVRTSENENTRFREAFERIEKGSQRFQYGGSVSKRALVELALLLKQCAQKDIRVVAFLPPYAHVVWRAMRSKGDDFKYLNEIAREVTPLFDHYGFRFFDFSDLATVGASDVEAVDGLHGSESAYLRMFLKMADDGQGLGQVAGDRGYLLDLLAGYCPDSIKMLAAQGSISDHAARQTAARSHSQLVD